MTTINGATFCINEAIPYFQPIVSADRLCIIGYEALGRLRSGQQIDSLGPFFNNEHIHTDEKIPVDSAIRNQSLKYFLASTSNSNGKLLFLNINPTFFTASVDEQFYSTLMRYEAKGLRPEQIVLEITEASFSNDGQTIHHRFEKYRQLGCKIAVDDVGKGFSTLDRIASLKPDILKIDLNLIKKSTHSQSYRDVLHSISILSERIGSSLLFEGIEDVEEMGNAWKHGAQFYQGFLFAYPNDQFIDRLAISNFLTNKLEEMIQHEVSYLKKRVLFEKMLNSTISNALDDIPYTQDHDRYIHSFIDFLPICCFRLYLCDRNGYQKSANFIKHSFNWIQQKQYRNKNWSWRPNLLKNIIHMQVNQTGILSESYRDIETKDNIYTFSYPVHNDKYLFIDIQISELLSM